MPEIASWLNQHGFTHNIRTLEATTATARDAANALGCDVGQIAKSLIFYAVSTNEPLLLITSGSNRVDKQKVGDYLKIRIKTASPEFVLEKTGFTVGGVPPVGHKTPLKTLIDKDLFHYEIIYAAAGTDHTVFSVRPDMLQRLTGSEIISVC